MPLTGYLAINKNWKAVQDSKFSLGVFTVKGFFHSSKFFDARIEQYRSIFFASRSVRNFLQLFVYV
jgi:hypothetical protein